MSQVIRVNRFTGEYRFLDKDGRITEDNFSTYPMESQDADVLMERIRQGYTYVTTGCYIVRLELTGFSEDDYFEIAEMVTFDLDDDGYSVPRQHTVITDKKWNEILFNNQGTPDGPSLKMAILDYEANTLKYVGDIFDEEPLVSDPFKASRAQWSDSIRMDILNNAVKIVMSDQPVHVSPIPVYFG